jgi:hypothetical protein
MGSAALAELHAPSGGTTIIEYTSRFSKSMLHWLLHRQTGVRLIFACGLIELNLIFIQPGSPTI